MNEENASARHRIYKYIQFIDPSIISFHIVPPTGIFFFRRLFLRGKIRRHYLYFIIVFLSRFAAIWSSTRYDAVLLQRDIITEFFYDPPLFIFALRLLNKRIIYDVDDAMWIFPPHSIRGGSLSLNILTRLRFYWNVRLSKIVIVSNEYLAEYVKKINRSVVVIPTPVSIGDFPVREHKNRETVVIGWTGGGGNLVYLKLLEKSLASLASKYPIKMRIISSRPVKMNGVDVEFIQWDKVTEAKHIATFDIGIMPLFDNPYTRGKGGFKILEYMAAGLPSLASPVGINARIIKNGENGFIAKDEKEWEDTLLMLIRNEVIRSDIGIKAREFVSGNYDYSVWVPYFVRAIEQGCGRTARRSKT
ncbi:MAG: glycosyltransferase [Bacteroidales bacterium]|nr:glycosyltransferase [Bacteroidales bacterium]